MKNNVKKAYKYASLIIFLIAMIALTAVSIPFVDSIKEPAEFKEFIGKFGVFGIVVTFFIQIAQVVVALIPGEVVEFMAGCLYGWLGGLLLCMAGITVGQILIFKMVKKFGKDFVEAAAGSKAVEKMKFLQNEKKLRRVIFILFFLPGTPKDLLTYVVPITSIKLKDFILITLFARVPSVVSSTYAGDAFVQNNYKTLLIAYGIIIVISAMGAGVFKLYERKKANKKSGENNNN